MKFSASCELLEKTVEIDGVMRDVYGIACMRAEPKWQGLGRMILRWSEEKARRDGKYCCVGFALPHTYERFDKKAGWSHCGMYQNWVITASIPVGKIVVNEHW